METVRSPQIWRRFDVLEQSVCQRINDISRHLAVRRFFVVISRLGDGAFWYVLMAAFAIFATDGLQVAAQMAATGLIGLALYKQLKVRLVRERPYISHARIRMGSAPLDRYSFPSGHTLYAVTFSSLAIAHLPALAALLVPFTLLVAASRVVLGLHYPTDVVAGALIGAALATASLSLWSI